MITPLNQCNFYVTGQGFKDIIRWPRPGYPVKKLQEKWAIEYGMPSTHAMVGVSIPFSVLFYTMDRYQYPIHWGVLISCAWCTLICVSRVYLGMHSVLVRKSSINIIYNKILLRNISELISLMRNYGLMLGQFPRSVNSRLFCC